MQVVRLGHEVMFVLAEKDWRHISVETSVGSAACELPRLDSPCAETRKARGERT